MDHASPGVTPKLKNIIRDAQLRDIAASHGSSINCVFDPAQHLNRASFDACAEVTMEWAPFTTSGMRVNDAAQSAWRWFAICRCYQSTRPLQKS